jgi:plasmid maintenance system killer protein
MWDIYEHHALIRKLSKIPLEVLKRYEKWKDIVIISGPEGLRHITGFHYEALKGQWMGFRSSRLGLQYRLIYKIQNQKLYVRVLDINALDYRKK